MHTIPHFIEIASVSAPVQQGCRCTGRFLPWVFLFGIAPLLVAQDDLEAWEFDAEYPNHVILGLGGVSVSGDEAQFAKRNRIGEEFWGGLESLRYRGEQGEGLLLDVQGRILPGIGDYLAKLRITKEDLGFLEVGYTSTRTYYDATGGYDPATGYSYSYFDESLHLDRSELWVAAHWTGDAGTSLDLRYRYRTREGKKGTSSWADGTTPGGRNLGIIPGFYEIDERIHSVELDVNHQNEQFEVNVGGVWQTHEQDNSRNFRRQPEQGADRYFVHREKFETDMLNGHGSMSYRFNEKTRLNVGTSYTRLDTILNGSRTINGEFSTVFDPNFVRQNRDHGFLDLDGETQVRQWVMNANLEIRASENLQIVPSVRVENYDTESLAHVMETNANGRGVDSFHELQPFGDSYWDDVAAELAVVYRGLPKWVLSAELLGSRGEGDIAETDLDVETAEILFDRSTRRDRSEQKISVTAKYYPQPGLNLVFNAYHKEGNNDFDHKIDPTAPVGGDRFPAYYEQLDFSTQDLNLRVTWRPSRQLSLVSRVDYQESTVSQRAADLMLVDSGDLQTVIYSQAFTLVPNDKVLLQGSVSFVKDRVKTPADDIQGLNPAIAPDGKNDYWQADLSANFTLSPTRSLMVRGFMYKSQGFSKYLSGAVSYGFTDEQRSILLTGRQKIDDFTTVSLQYGYYDLSELTTGGRNDYDAHVVYCRWERQF